MSFQLLSNVHFKIIGNSTDKFVLHCLAFYADDTGGKCFPSLQTIATYTDNSPRTVERSLKRLETLGLINIIRRRRGRPGAEEVSKTHYQINVDKINGKCRNFNAVEKAAPITRERSKNDKMSDNLSNNYDKLSETPAPLIGVTANEQSNNPPLTPPSGGSVFEPEPLVQEFTAEQQAYVESKPEAERDKWAALYREENAAVWRKEQEAMRAALEDAQLRAQIPTVEAATHAVLRHTRQLVHGRRRGKELYVELAIRSDHRPPHQVMRDMCRSWDKFVANLPLMKYQIGFIKFINNGLWSDERQWPWDRERMHLQAAASVGTWRQA